MPWFFLLFFLSATVPKGKNQSRLVGRTYYTKNPGSVPTISLPIIIISSMVCLISKFPTKLSCMNHKTIRLTRSAMLCGSVAWPLLARTLGRIAGGCGAAATVFCIGWPWKTCKGSTFYHQRWHLQEKTIILLKWTPPTPLPGFHHTQETKIVKRTWEPEKRSATKGETVMCTTDET